MTKLCPTCKRALPGKVGRPQISDATKREIKRRRAAGETYPAIAAALRIGVNTVARHASG